MVPDNVSASVRETLHRFGKREHSAEHGLAAVNIISSGAEPVTMDRLTALVGNSLILCTQYVFRKFDTYSPANFIM